MKLKQVFLPLTLAALLASCGSTTPTPESSAPASSEPPVSSSTPASSSVTSASSEASGIIPVPSVDEVTVSFWTPFGQTPLSAATKAASDFEKLVKEETGVTVHVEVTYQGDYAAILDKISKGYAVGDVPTMAIAYPDHVANYFGIAKDFVYDLEPYFNDPNVGFGTQEFLGDDELYDEADFVEAFLDEGKHYKYEGTYSMPLMKSSEVLFYNKDAVDAILATIGDDFLPNADRSGAEAFINSLNWDEFMEVGKYALDHKDRILDTIVTPITYDSDGNLFISKMYQEGIAYSSIGEDGIGRIDFESGKTREKAEKMVTDLAKAANDGVFTTKGVTGLYGSTGFARGESIFTVGSSGGAGYTAPDGATFEFGVTRVPASNDNPLYVSQGPTMAFLRNPRLSSAEQDARMYYAWQFAKYLTNPDVNVYLCTWGSEGYVPVRYSAYETGDYQDFLEDGETLADTAKVLINEINGNYLNSDVFIGSAQLRTQVGGIITQVFSGTKDVTTAFDDAIGYVKTYLK